MSTENSEIDKNIECFEKFIDKWLEVIPDFYVAIIDGKLIDVDTNRNSLQKRIYNIKKPKLIQKVEKQEPIQLRNPLK